MFPTRSCLEGKWPLYLTSKRPFHGDAFQHGDCRNEVMRFVWRFKIGDPQNGKPSGSFFFPVYQNPRKRGILQKNAEPIPRETRTHRRGSIVVHLAHHLSCVRNSQASTGNSAQHCTTKPELDRLIRLQSCWEICV